jgi:cyanophycinase
MRNKKNSHMNIKGVLVAIGGNEDKGIKSKKTLHVQDTVLEFTSGILHRVLTEIKSTESAVEVITTASEFPVEVGKVYLRAFKKLGHKNTNVLHIRSREEAEHPEVIERIKNAGCIMFSGGDQFILTSVLQGTSITDIIHEKYLNEEFVIAGTSAGAMAMPRLMIYPGREPLNVLRKLVPVYKGLSLINDVIIDTHFLVRGRFRRLAVAIAEKPENLGIGLEEDTGIIVREGNKIEAIGSGLVTIIDAGNIYNENISVESDRKEIFIENLLVHIMANGDHFTLKRKKIT